MQIDYEKKYRELRAALFVLYGQKFITWGSLHIALDDNNLSDNDVAFCAKYAEERDDLLGQALAYLLLEMSPEEREVAPVDRVMGEAWLRDKETEVLIAGL